MARILICYASSEGQTRKVAQRLGARLGAGGHEVTLRDLRATSPAEPLDPCDAVVLGASVHYETHPALVKRFVRAHRDELARVPSTFFSVSVSAGGLGPKGVKTAERYVARFLRSTAWRPTEVALFGGALLYTRYPAWKRLLLRLIVGLGGGSTDTSRDHEYTDWAAVDRLADRVGPVAAVVLER
jgi:menaquinone-dependent protoporphyrinogen oxidase